MCTTHLQWQIDFVDFDPAVFVVPVMNIWATCPFDVLPTTRGNIPTRRFELACDSS